MVNRIGATLACLVVLAAADGLAAMRGWSGPLGTAPATQAQRSDRTHRAASPSTAALAPASTAASAPAAAADRGTARLIDRFDDVSAWSAHPADGVAMELSSDGGALRVDFDFQKGGGYAVLRRAVDLALPAHYAFAFRIRGDAPPNNLELKLIDSTDANVWWRNQRDFQFPLVWRTETVKKRHIQFAWGPAGGGEIRRVKAIEFAITAGSGGKGTVWLDDLELRELPPPSAGGPITARASSSRQGLGPERAVDASAESEWRSELHDRLPWLELDCGGSREFSAVLIRWAEGGHPGAYVLEATQDGESWSALRTVQGGDGGLDPLFTPEAEARWLRVRVLDPVGPRGIGIAEVRLQPLAWAESPNGFFQQLARAAPRGRYPRGLTEQTYWTVVGEDGRPEEGLMGEDGALEAGKAGFSVEPFLYADGKLWTWNEAEVSAGLPEGGLPLPLVRWRAGDLELTVQAFAADSSMFARYVVRRPGGGQGSGTLYLAVRPFQVNPPSQTLNTPGGVAPIRRIALNRRQLVVNENQRVVALTPAQGFGAATFDEGDVVTYLARGTLPAARGVRDPFGYASAALAYPFKLGPSQEVVVDLQIPIQGGGGEPETGMRGAVVRSLGWLRAQAIRRPPRPGERLELTKRAWRRKLGAAAVALPPMSLPLEATLQAQLAYILVNRDGPAIQPGSRSYDRSWIRDGALTSSALLRLGHAEEVHDFIDWFASFQYENGKVPCCVDRRGADPVPEHDSHGEFIFLVAEYLRYTRDLESTRTWWPNVSKAAAHLDTLRRQRRTDEYRRPANRHFFGLLPPSISHEGYSAKPMHSYWDDFFALRGFKDAVYLARELGLADEAASLDRIRAEFAQDLSASIRAAMARHKIDFVPGCADLGDFDATSTTIALAPVQAGGVVPEKALERTFQRYWEIFRERRSRGDWDAYTPYELRNVGAFVRLGWRDRAHELLDFFMAHQRPAGWAQWAEVVGREERKPRFLGDMPHTWVGSDFIRSLLDMIAYERERDSSLVIAAGIRASWLGRGPVAVRGLRTPYGALDLLVRPGFTAGTIEVRLDRIRVPPGGLIVAAPLMTSRGKAWVDGKPVPVLSGGEVRVSKVPATVILEP